MKGIGMDVESVRGILTGRKTQMRWTVALREFARSDTPGYEWTFRDKRALWNDVSIATLIDKFCPNPPGLYYVKEALAPRLAREGRG